MISLIKAQLKAGVFSSLGRSHKLIMLIVLLMGCLVTSAMGWVYQRSLDANSHQYLTDQAENYVDGLSHHIHFNLRVIDVLWALFEGSEAVSVEEFNHVAGQLFVPASHLEFVMWLPDRALDADAVRHMDVSEALNFPPKHGQIWPVINFLKQHVGDKPDAIQPRFSDLRLGLPFLKQGIWLESPLQSLTFDSEVAVVALPMPRKSAEVSAELETGWLVVGLALESIILEGIKGEEFKSLFLAPDAGLEVVQHVREVKSKIYGSQTDEMSQPDVSEVLPLGPDIYWEISFYPSQTWMKYHQGIGLYMLLGFGFVLTCLLYIGLALRFGMLERRAQGLLEQVQTLEEQLVVLGKESARDLDTGLMLREDMDTKLDMECRRAVREFLPLSFLIVSVDHSHDWHELPEAGFSFKRVVQCLVESISRPGDAGFRFDEFSAAFVLPATNEQVSILAERCREKVEQLVIINPQTQHILTVSIGVVTLQPTEDLCADKVVDAAVNALTQAQAKDGNCVVAEFEESDELPVTFLV